jgi:hypothetical protein
MLDAPENNTNQETKSSAKDSWIWNLHLTAHDFQGLENDPSEAKMRAIAYSIDILAPGFYLWLWGFVLRIGGCEPDDTPYRYSGKIHSRAGVAIVLPGYHIWTTYTGSYDPGQTSN